MHPRKRGRMFLIISQKAKGEKGVFVKINVKEFPKNTCQASKFVIYYFGKSHTDDVFRSVPLQAEVENAGKI